MINVMILTKKAMLGKAVQIVFNNYQEIHVDLLTDGSTAINRLTGFDVILVDVDVDDFKRLMFLKTSLQNNKVIIVDFLENGFLEYNFTATGCLGYVLQTKEVSIDALYTDILETAAGIPLEKTTKTDKVCKLFSKIICAHDFTQIDEKCLECLTGSEWNLIRNIGLGLTNKEISAKMYLSEGTVRNYLSNILSKLCLRDRTQLAIWANRSGVVDQDQQEENSAALFQNSN